MNNLLERVGIRMPAYHNVKDLKKGRRIIVTPLSKWRSVFRSFPYFVGDIVRLKLEALGENEIDGKFQSYYVTEFFGGVEKNTYSIDISPYNFEGRVIDGEGDVRYSIGLLPGHDTHVVMTAKVINKDGIFFQTVFFIAGAFITFAVTVLAWILGYIKIVW